MRNGEGLSMEQVIAFIENAPANIFFKDTSCRYRAVSEACALINGKENFDIIGKTDVEIWADHEVGQRYYVDDLHILETGKPSKWIDDFSSPDKPFFIEISKKPAYLNNELIGVVGIVTDVTEQKQTELKLERLSTTDELTGLYNRNYLEQASSKKYSEEYYPIGIIIMDCNRLKETNDTLGHRAGDELLARIAKAIKQSIPSNALAARLGGDEFLVATTQRDEEGIQQVIDEIEQHFHDLSDETYILDVALGHSVATSPSESLHAAFRDADAKMYQDKKQARVGFHRE